MRVPSDSIEADEWLTPAAARSQRRRKTTERRKTVREIERAVKPIAEVAVTAAAPRVARGVSAVKAAGAAVGLGAGATAASIAAALAVGYAIGTGLMALWKRLTPTERNARKALAFRKARLEFAKRHGRQMSADEVRAMGRGFLQSIGRVK